MATRVSNSFRPLHSPFTKQSRSLTAPLTECIIRKTVEVVAAVIFDPEGRIFATQRGYGEWKDWWEFPGGKIEPGETPQEALVREIREELDAEIEVGELIRTIDYDYPAFHLTMHCFRCHMEERTYDPSAPTPSFTLLEHEAARWLTPQELDSLRWLPADIELINSLSQTPQQHSIDTQDSGLPSPVTNYP